MNTIVGTSSEHRVLRWGGLAGVLGSALLFSTFVIVGAFVVPLATTPEQLLARFPDIRAARIAENGLYLAAVVLWAFHIAAIGQALDEPRSSAALFGRTAAMIGLGALAAGALPHLATVPISDAYHAAGASPAVQAALVAEFEAMQGIFDALLVTGLLALPLGMVGLGVAMRGSPAFGTRVGSATLGLAVVALGAGVASVIEVSGVVIIGFLALMALHLVSGWKAFRVSRRTRTGLVPARAAQEGSAA